MASVAVFIADPKQSGERPEHENVALREEIDRASMFEGIVGTSAALRRVLSLLSKVAPTDATVMVTGETGTGKELVARAIHRRSRRSSRAFVSVNCAAIPRDLIASAPWRSTCSQTEVRSAIFPVPARRAACYPVASKPLTNNY